MGFSDKEPSWAGCRPSMHSICIYTCIYIVHTVLDSCMWYVWRFVVTPLWSLDGWGMWHMWCSQLNSICTSFRGKKQACRLAAVLEILFIPRFYQEKVEGKRSQTIDEFTFREPREGFARPFRRAHRQDSQVGAKHSSQRCREPQMQLRFVEIFGHTAWHDMHSVNRPKYR